MFKAILEVVKFMEPDEIVHIGDLMDYPQPSRWTKGTREEFEGNIYSASEAAKKVILEPLRAVFDGPIGVHEGNHDMRPRLYLEKYAPALSQTDMLNFENLLDFDGFGITRLPDFYNVAAGWITTHGHLGGIRLNQNAGMTALNGAKRIGKNIIMGHTHRAGVSSFTQGIEGQTNTITGVEVGHILNPKAVTYLRGASGNWQQGFALLEIDKNNVTPRILPVLGNKVIVDGVVFPTR